MIPYIENRSVEHPEFVSDREHAASISTDGFLAEIDRASDVIAVDRISIDQISIVKIDEFLRIDVL
ncbi:hypothetical protein MOF7_16170 [Methylobacterium oryzae]